MARRMSNPLALAVLATLSESPAHPYEISSKLRERGKEFSIKINYGSLYSVVESLRRKGFIEERETRQEGNRPARTTYAITEAGTVELHDWMDELLAEPVKEYPALEAALSLLPVVSPDHAVELLRRRMDRLEAKLAEYAELDRKSTVELKLPRLFMIEFDYHVAMTKAELTFVRKLITKIRDDALSGVRGWRKMHKLLEAGLSAAEIFAHFEQHVGKEEDQALAALDKLASEQK